MLYIPFSLLLGSDSTASTSLLDLSFPILDVTPVTASSISDFFVSLDLARGSTPAEAITSSLRRVSLSAHSLSLAEDASAAAIASSAALSTDKLPNVASLYPVLSLLHHPDQSFEDGADDRQLDDAPGKGRGKGRKELKRGAESSPAREGGTKEVEGAHPSKKTGKRAAGRAEINRRLEEQKAKLERGEKVAEKETMEVEAAATL